MACDQQCTVYAARLARAPDGRWRCDITRILTCGIDQCIRGPTRNTRIEAASAALRCIRLMRRTNARGDVWTFKSGLSGK